MFDILSYCCREHRRSIRLFRIIDLFTSDLKMAERSAYLSRFTADYITQLCELNHIDTTEVRSKQDRVAALCALPNMTEEATQSNAGSKTEELMRLMKEIDSSRRLDTEQLCESLMRVMTKNTQTSSELSGLHKLSSDDDIECYLNTFERIAKASGKPKSAWPSLLEPYLTGKAQQAFHVLSECEKDDYDKVVQAIRRRYNLTAEAYRVRFKSDSKRNDETFEEFGNRLMVNFFRWVEIPQTTADIHEVNRCLNLIMIDQFLSTIADDICA